MCTILPINGDVAADICEFSRFSFFFFLEMAEFHLERCSQEQSPVAFCSEVRYMVLV